MQPLKKVLRRNGVSGDRDLTRQLEDAERNVLPFRARDDEREARHREKIHMGR
jgi:hypothetical protein